MKAFVHNAVSPRVYIVGRTQDAAERIIRECEILNKDGKVEFIKADVSELSEVDRVCREIMSKEKHINLIVQTQGNLNLRGRDGQSHIAFSPQAHELPVLTDTSFFSVSRRSRPQICAQLLLSHALHFQPPTTPPNRKHNHSTLCSLSECLGLRVWDCFKYGRPGTQGYIHWCKVCWPYDHYERLDGYGVCKAGTRHHI